MLVNRHKIIRTKLCINIERVASNLDWTSVKKTIKIDVHGTFKCTTISKILRARSVRIAKTSTMRKFHIANTIAAANGVCKKRSDLHELYEAIKACCVCCLFCCSHLCVSLPYGSQQLLCEIVVPRLALPMKHKPQANAQALQSIGNRWMIKT